MEEIILKYSIGFIRKIIDWEIFIPILIIISSIYILNLEFSSIYINLEFSNRINNFLKYSLIVSPLISRKFVWGTFYYSQVYNFIKFLNLRIKTEQNFKDIWKYYCNICDIDNNDRMKVGGINVKYYIQKVISYNKLESLRINAGTNELIRQIKYEEDLLFYTFVHQICDFASSYDHMKHNSIVTELIEKPLNQFPTNNIKFKPFLIKIINDCHNDGVGYLSTLGLLLSISIYLRLPNRNQVMIEDFFVSISNMDIGWLNRRIFEVAIATSMIELPPDEKFKELRTDLKNLEIQLKHIRFKERKNEYLMMMKIERIKNDFRDKILKPRMNQMRLDYAE